VSGGVVWAEIPDDDRGDAEAPESAAHGAVDESFAARRLRRWIKGMFGGGEAARPRRGSVEGAPGEPEGSPGESD
jgi:hypothetical protein